jgi:hypothetical protein
LLELLERNPHPNVTRYHSYEVLQGRIVGLVLKVLKRYRCALEGFMNNGEHDLDMELAFDGIMSAGRHLHALQLAYLLRLSGPIFV